MKKIRLALMCIASATIMAACGGNANAKNNGDNNNDNGAAPATITRTKWLHESENDLYRLTISVENNANLYFNNYNEDGELLDSGNLWGDVTYSNGQGSIPLGDNGENVGTATFTVNGKEMLFTFKGKTVTMKNKPID